jgi:hypothetical protein
MAQLEDELMDILAEEIAKEIDAEILFSMYKNMGWYPVENCHNLSFNHTALKQVELWLTTICSDAYHIKSHTDYIFKSKEDALMFQLKWS